MDQNLIHIGKAPGCQFTWNESGTFVRDFSLDLKGSSFVWNVTLMAMALHSETMLLHAEHHWVATATPHHEPVSYPLPQSSKSAWGRAAWYSAVAVVSWTSVAEHRVLVPAVPPLRLADSSMSAKSQQNCQRVVVSRLKWRSREFCQKLKIKKSLPN